MGACSYPQDHTLLILTAAFHKFNLETFEKDIYKDQLRIYRSISNTDSAIPSLEMQVLLSIPELASNQALVFLDEGSSRIKVEPVPSFILLESWTLSFPRSHSYETAQAEVTLPTVYKHSISVFRSLYTLLRILPVWDLFKRLRRTAYNSRNGTLAIQVNLGELPPGVLCFGEISCNFRVIQRAEYDCRHVSNIKVASSDYGYPNFPPNLTSLWFI
jgi:autophagy-related protein 13